MTRKSTSWLSSWLSSWATTLRIMIFERETWRVLREDHDPGQFTDAARPGDPGQPPLHTEFSSLNDD